MSPDARPPRRRIPVAVLGATGAVGQTFVRLLAGHPWFDLVELAASERSVGKRYAEAAHWIDGVMPGDAGTRQVVACDPAHVCAPIVFSALDAGVAGDVEGAFANAGRIVLSNARNYRLEEDVPLLIPEVNPDHLALLEAQRAGRGWRGAIITNSNCSTMVIALALAPLHQAFGVRQVFVTTLQAVSGAGYPGVASLDILGNIIPYIANEEEKIERETVKILGRLDGRRVRIAPMQVSAHTNRVPVEHGHTACMSVALERRATPVEAMDAIRRWTSAVADLELPTAPARAVALTEEPDRPQPKRDVSAGGGMTVTIGRVRPDPVLDLRLVASGHNTIRGAAGASILNAELLVARGMVTA
jgi:aspartate-semialdehyde dehydrogenase